MMWAIGAAILSFVGTYAIKEVALRLGIVDRPTDARKIHERPTPLLGGAAIYVAMTVFLLLALAWSPILTGGEITWVQYVGFLVGGAILMIGGLVDDWFVLAPHTAILAPILAALVAIATGTEVEKLTNPFGGVIYLVGWQSDVLVFCWLLVVMYTTKFLDGLDGLATSVSSIAALMMMLLAMTVAYAQPDVALFASIALGAFLGFLPWNFHPARIFLGEGGSTFIGYTVGTLAIISGGKVATALLVLGIPLLDVLWVILRRWRKGGFAAIVKGDRKHLHHRMLDLGLGQRTIVAGYAVVAAAFGFAALFLQSREKLIALGALCLVMLILAVILVGRDYARISSVR